jgi:polysaccharide biosynthesis protein PslG
MGMTMRSLPLAALLVALALVPAAASAAAPIPVGLSDQNPGAFTDPLFAPLGIRYARYVTPWDVSVKPQLATERLDAWIVAAETAGVEPLISFEHSATDKCPDSPCKAPTVAAFTAAFNAFHAKYPEIDDISAWNEASHVTQPTFRRPALAAAYYRAVVDNCQFCTVVAADLLDTSPHMEEWLTAFAKAAPEADLWGLHNYGDANYFRTKGIDTVLKTVKGDVWLTETGSIVSFTTASGKVSFKPSQARAAKAMSYLFDDVVPHSSRIKRVYVYNWLSDPKNRWDSGLVGHDGKPRKIYDIVKQYIGAAAATGVRSGTRR